MADLHQKAALFERTASNEAQTHSYDSSVRNLTQRPIFRSGNT